MCYSQNASNSKLGSADYPDFKSEKVRKSNECAVLRYFDCTLTLLLLRHTCLLMNNSKRQMKTFILPINTEVSLQPNTASCGELNALVILRNPQVILNL